MDDVALRFLKTVFKFRCSYFFSVFGLLVFVAVGLDDGLKPLPFLFSGARTFFVRRFSCIPLSKVLLFFLQFLV